MIAARRKARCAIFGHKPDPKNPTVCSWCGHKVSFRSRIEVK